MEINYLDTSNYVYYQNKYHLSKLSSMVLASKNLSDDECDDLLLNDCFKDITLAKGIKEVVERINLAKIRNEKIIVCGDYDAGAKRF